MRKWINFSSLRKLALTGCYVSKTTSINHLANGAVRMNDSLQHDRFAHLADKCLKLRDKWVIREACTIQQELLALDLTGNDSSQVAAIDLASLESLDLSGIQLLLSLRNYSNPSAAIDSSSNAVAREWLELCGV